MKNNTEGYSKGDTCNRDNCKGVIDEHDTDGCCSCHINPPCSFCETNRSYCPECDWDAEAEDIEYRQQESRSYYKGFGSKRMHDDFYKRKAIQDKFDSNFRLMWKGEKEAEKLIVIYKSHTNSSMIKQGVFPKGSETRESLVSKIKGTFGGRFELLDDFRFKYIAYTD